MLLTSVDSCCHMLTLRRVVPNFIGYGVFAKRCRAELRFQHLFWRIRVTSRAPAAHAENNLDGDVVLVGVEGESIADVLSAMIHRRA